MHHIFDPFPILYSQRLCLRKPLLADAYDLFEMRSDPEVMRYVPRPLATKVEDVKALINMVNDYAEKGERINWAIEWKETGKVIGMIGYVDTLPDHNRAEVGYSLTRSWHRKGITREALRAVLAFGFEQMALHTVAAVIDAENVASGRLLEQAGFRQEAHFREDFLFGGSYRNSIHFGMLRSEFDALKAAW